MALPPFDLWPLAFVALVPLLWALRDTRVRDGALLGFAFGLVFYGVMLEWSLSFGVVAYVPFVIAGGCYTAAFAAMVVAFDRRGSRSPFLIAAVWAVFEALKGRFPFGGLPWADAGVALHDVAWGRALATWGGMALVTFVIVAVNGWLLVLGLAVARRRVQATTPGPSWRIATAALVVIVAMVTLADVARPTPTVTGHVKFALLQGNDEDRAFTAKEIANNYLARSHFQLASRLRGHYDLVVFPEGSLERDPERSAFTRNGLTDLAARLGAVVVANARTPAPHNRLYNSNLVYSPDGTLQGTYAKQHLVPFGEYVPFRDELGFVNELKQVPYDYEAGHGRRLFTAAGHPFETLICFESIFAPQVRDAVRDGAQFLVVTTSNRLFHRSGVSAQHVALSQMRAAETGRAILHSAVSGITAVVEPDGRVHDQTDLFVKDVTTGTIPTTTGTTPYVRLGEWALALCCIGLVAAAVAAQRRHRSRTTQP